MIERAGGRTSVPQIFINGAACRRLRRSLRSRSRRQAGAAASGPGSRKHGVSTPFTVACIQLNSGREIAPNIEATRAWSARRGKRRRGIHPDAGEHDLHRAEARSAPGQGPAGGEPPGHSRLPGAGGGDRRLAPDRLAHHQARRQDLRQSQLPLRSQGRDRGALRQDPHVRRRSRQLASAIANPPPSGRAIRR